MLPLEHSKRALYIHTACTDKNGSNNKRMAERYSQSTIKNRGGPVIEPRQKKTDQHTTALYPAFPFPYVEGRKKHGRTPSELHAQLLGRQSNVPQENPRERYTITTTRYLLRYQVNYYTTTTTTTTTTTASYFCTTTTTTTTASYFCGT